MTKFTERVTLEQLEKELSNLREKQQGQLTMEQLQNELRELKEAQQSTW